MSFEQHTMVLPIGEVVINCTRSCIAVFSDILVIFWFLRSTETRRSRLASVPVVGDRRSAMSHLHAVPPVPRPPYHVHLRHWTTLPASRGARPVVSAYLSSIRRWLLRRNWGPIRQRRGWQPGDGTGLFGETWARCGRHNTAIRWLDETVVQSYSTGRSWWNGWRKRVDC